MSHSHESKAPRKGLANLAVVIGGIAAFSIIASFSEAGAFALACGVIAFAAISMAFALWRK